MKIIFLSPRNIFYFTNVTRLSSRNREIPIRAGVYFYVYFMWLFERIRLILEFYATATANASSSSNFTMVIKNCLFLNNLFVSFRMPLEKTIANWLVKSYVMQNWMKKGKTRILLSSFKMSYGRIAKLRIMKVTLTRKDKERHKKIETHFSQRNMGMQTP